MRTTLSASLIGLLAVAVLATAGAAATTNRPASSRSTRTTAHRHSQVSSTNRVKIAAAVTNAIAGGPATNTASACATNAMRLRIDLEGSLKDLAALRESIAGEKIPLAKQLGEIEDQLSYARKEYEKSRRLVDTRNLDLANLKGELKLRQEEMDYVGNLLDEYARSFEGRVHVSEMQRFQPLVEAALQAPQNKDLTLSAKLAQQIALVSASVARVGMLIGGLRFEGTAVDPQGTLDKGRFALIGPVALFASSNGAVTGLAMAQAGSSQPAVRPLDPTVAPNFASVIATGQGLLPFDPTRGDALKALIAKGSLWGYFKKGGPIMWPLLGVSILAFSVILERLLFLLFEGGRRSPKTVRAILAALERRNVEEAIRATATSKDFVARCLRYALANREKSLTDALMRSTAAELHRYSRGLSILDTIVTMAPLLGLLGTVTGMIGAFGMLGGAELSAPAAITGGIAEALLATTFGLGIAITTLIPLNYLHTRSDQARHELQDAATHLELLMKPIQEAEAAQAANTETAGDSAGRLAGGQT